MATPFQLEVGVLQDRLGSWVWLSSFRWAGWNEQSCRSTRSPEPSPWGLLGRARPRTAVFPFATPPSAAACPSPGPCSFQVPGACWHVAAWGCLYIERHTSTEATSSACFLVFLLSQNRPMTPARDLVSSLAKGSRHSQLPRAPPPPHPPGPDPCPLQDGGVGRHAVKYK